MGELYEILTKRFCVSCNSSNRDSYGFICRSNIIKPCYMLRILHITWFNDIASTDETVAVPITTIAANTKPFS